MEIFRALGVRKLARFSLEMWTVKNASTEHLVSAPVALDAMAKDNGESFGSRASNSNHSTQTGRQTTYLPSFLMGHKPGSPARQRQSSSTVSSMQDVPSSGSLGRSAFSPKVRRQSTNIGANPVAGSPKKASPMGRHEEWRRSQTLLETVHGGAADLGISKKRATQNALPPTASLQDFYKVPAPAMIVPSGLGSEPRSMDFDRSSNEAGNVNMEELLNWTTVFGFPPEEMETVIQYLYQIGPITDIVATNSSQQTSAHVAALQAATSLKRIPAGPTWIHVRWKDRLDAIQVQNHQGTVINCKHQSISSMPQYMLGIMPLSKSIQRLQELNNMDVIWSALSPTKHRRASASTIPPPLSTSEQYQMLPRNVFLSPENSQTDYNYSRSHTGTSRALEEPTQDSSTLFLHRSNSGTIPITVSSAPTILDRLLGSLLGS
jgi:hypothetical protein